MPLPRPVPPIRPKEDEKNKASEGLYSEDVFIKGEIIIKETEENEEKENK